MGDATLILNGDGTAADASPEALAILGVTMDRLRQLPRGAFSPTPSDPEADASFQHQWEEQGSPDIGGEATIQQPDGEKVRVKFAISPLDDGRYQVVLMRTGGLPDDPTSVYTAGAVLTEWRAAERRLRALEPGSRDYDRVQADIEAFRVRYQELFRARS